MTIKKSTQHTNKPMSFYYTQRDWERTVGYGTVPEERKLENMKISEISGREYGYDSFGNSLRPGDDEGNTEPPNNFAIYINGKKWKIFQGRGQYADDFREKRHYQQLKDWARKKSQDTGKKWEVFITGENPEAQKPERPE